MATDVVGRSESSPGNKSVSDQSGVLFVGRENARRPATLVWGFIWLGAAFIAGSFAASLIDTSPEAATPHGFGSTAAFILTFIAAIVAYWNFRNWITREESVLVVSADGVSQTVGGCTTRWDWPEIVRLEFRPGRRSAIRQVIVWLNRSKLADRMQIQSISDTFTALEHNEIIDRLCRHFSETGIATEVVSRDFLLSTIPAPMVRWSTPARCNDPDCRKDAVAQTTDPNRAGLFACKYHCRRHFDEIIATYREANLDPPELYSQRSQSEIRFDIELITCEDIGLAHVILRELAGAARITVNCDPYELLILRQAVVQPIVQPALTHKTLTNTIKALGGRLESVIVNDLLAPEGTFKANLRIRRDGEMVEIDVRPCDAFVAAVAADVPIYVTVDVLASLAQA